MSNREESWVARFPWGVLLLLLMVPAIGSVNLASAAQATMPDLYLRQMAWLGIALVFGAVVIRVKTSTWELMTYPIYGIVCALLVLVLVAGVTIKGSQRWIDLGPMNLQPSELGKISIVLVGARYFANYRVDEGYTLRKLLRPLNFTRPLGIVAVMFLRWWKQDQKAAQFAAGTLAEAPSIDPTWMKGTVIVVCGLWLIVCLLMLVKDGVHHRRIIAPVDVIMVPFALVLIEPDLGTSLIIMAIAIAQVLFTGVRRGSLAIASISGVGVVAFAWQFILKDYQKRRVYTFLNPENDLQGAGYHASQSMIAIGSGGLSGKGHLEGTQTQLSFLPENHTDFVFSVLAEEWGFVGGFVLILVFMGLLVAVLRLGTSQTERFAALVCVGAAAMVFCHVVINIGMVTGLLPVVGVTLPFMSYGGSSMITMVVAVALAMGTAVWRR